jgi:hypothetical protein
MRPVLLSRVLYVPALQSNLLFVLHLVTKHDFRVNIERDTMSFVQRGVLCFTATIRENTAWVYVETVVAPESALRGETTLDRALWHRRLCHIRPDLLEKAIRGNVATGMHVEGSSPAPSHCEPCIVGKHHRDPFPHKASHRATAILERIHSDLHKLPVLTASGYRYWVTFIDDYSRYSWVYLLRKKSETFDAFVQFRTLLEKQYGVPILCLHDDKGGEFIGNKWEAYMAEHGIRREQGDGTAERRGRTAQSDL